MKVLKGRILVAIAANSTDSLVGDTNATSGTVEVSGSDQINEGDLVMFGGSYEEIEIRKNDPKRHYLMNEENVKIFFEGKTPSNDNQNVLPFFKEQI